MKTGIFFLTLLFSICFSSFGQVDAYQEEIIGWEYSATHDEVIEVLKPQFEVSNVPEDVWDALKTGREEQISKLVTFMAFAYRKHFTREEIAAMHQFYNSEAAVQLRDDASKLTKKQKEAIVEYNESEVARKAENNKQQLAEDVERIVKTWKRDVFGDMLKALVKQGYRTGY